MPSLSTYPSACISHKPTWEPINHVGGWVSKMHMRPPLDMKFGVNPMILTYALDPMATSFTVKKTILHGSNGLVHIFSAG